LAFTLGDINPTDRVDTVKIELAELIAKPTSFFRFQARSLDTSASVVAATSRV
jgi:hypothetical protein